MAKAYSATLQGKYSDVVLGRVVAFGDTGWNFKEVDMTFAKANKLGLLVKADGTPVAAAADAADIYGVLVDRSSLPGVTEWPNATPEDGEVLPHVLAVRGLTLNAKALHYADGAVIDAAGIAVLEGNANQVTDKVVGLEFIGSVL